MFEAIGTVLPVTTFAAVCEGCDWIGTPRTNNLAALRDFDRHAQTAVRHGLSVTVPTELCADCGHPTDGHDRRAEDGRCEACGYGEPCVSRY